MKFNKQSLRQFFQLFQKPLSDSEISLLLKGDGEWSPSSATKLQLEKIQKYSWIFYFIPGLKAVFFCNTTAFRSADNNSDIDLFVVAENGKLWIVRVFLTLITQVIGLRRHGKKVKNRFCLSFFATESGALSLENLQIKKNNDPYLALWCATAECIAVRKNFLTEFHVANSWINNYGLKFTQSSEPQTLSCLQRWIGSMLKFFGLEWALKKLLLPRAQKKSQHLQDKSGTIISEKYLKFHDKDIREEIANDLA